MAKKSSNDIGNPYHDEETGEFTSPDSSSGMETTKPKIKLKLKEGGDIQGLINDINQCSNVPFLSTSTEIEQNIENFFSKPVIEKIDSLYGDPNNVGCASYQFRPKSNPHIRLEIFPNVLGKYRYKDNRAHIVSAEEFNNYKGTKIYRGISSSGEKARSIVNSYGKIDLDNFDYYCPNGGNCYGSNIYTTVDKWYAQRYAGYSGTLIEGKIDESSSKHMTYSEVHRVMHGIDGNKVYNSVATHLNKQGLSQERAQRIAKSFSTAIKNDPGIVAILMGLDYYISDNHQRNLFNLSKWVIKEI